MQKGPSAPLPCMLSACMSVWSLLLLWCILSAEGLSILGRLTPDDSFTLLQLAACSAV